LSLFFDHYLCELNRGITFSRTYFRAASVFVIIILLTMTPRKGNAMKNRFVVLVSIILVILLTGCNLPAGKTQTGTPDYIGTQVATMLTAQPTLQPVVDTPVQSSAQPTNESPTAQPSETSTPTATPTATTSPEDPRVLLGNPTYTDTLDNGKSFGLESKAYDDDYTYIRVENGALVLTSRYATGFRGWRTGGTKLGNAYLEAKVKVGECSGYDSYGLVLRSPDFVKGYWFQVTCTGNWDFGYWDGSEYSSLKSGTNTTNAMLTGSNQTSRLGVWASGSHFKLYINGKLIGEVDDSSLTDAGSFGAVIASYNTPNLTIWIDEFSYWNLD